MNKEKKAFIVSISSLAAILIASIIISFVSKLIVILALPVGILFGFAIQKGDLCGSSAMSEVLLFKDKSKIFGLWVAIVSSMVGFAILAEFGVVELAPKKLIWLSSLVGGIIFGIGTVLGGGCISGCMYKGATGNINSIAALMTIPIGIAFVDYGPLKSLSKYLLTFVINGENGKPVSLYSLIGIPYWIIVLLITAITVVFGYRFIKRKEELRIKQKSPKGFSTLFTKSWQPWHSGIAIGIIGVLAWLSSLPTGRNYPLGVTHGVSYAYQMILDDNINVVYQKPDVSIINLNKIGNKTIQPEASNKSKSPAFQNIISEPPKKKIVLWLVLLVIGFVFGAFISGKMSGQAKLVPKPPEQILTALFGGFLIGVGAAIGTGCVIGNIISGWAMMSVGMLIFGFATLIGNWATTVVYLIGIKNI